MLSLITCSLPALAQKETGARLSAAGYNDFVITRLLENNTLANEVSQMTDAELGPVTFFRGLAVRPSEYRPKFIPKRYAGYSFLTQDFFTAYMYGKASGDPDWPGGVILRYQIPRKWLIQFRSAGNNLSVPPDYFPEAFVTDFGIFNLTGAIKEQTMPKEERLGKFGHSDWDPETDAIKFVRWIPYGEVIENLSMFRARFRGLQALHEFFIDSKEPDGHPSKCEQSLK